MLVFVEFTSRSVEQCYLFILIHSYSKLGQTKQENERIISYGERGRFSTPISAEYVLYYFIFLSL